MRIQLVSTTKTTLTVSILQITLAYTLLMTCHYIYSAASSPITAGSSVGSWPLRLYALSEENNQDVDADMSLKGQDPSDYPTVMGDEAAL